MRKIGTTMFVNRDAELTYLRSRLRLAGNGKPGCVFVLGDFGVGKTTLLTELVARAERAATAQAPVIAWVPLARVEDLSPACFLRLLSEALADSVARLGVGD